MPKDLAAANELSLTATDSYRLHDDELEASVDGEASAVVSPRYLGAPVASRSHGAVTDGELPRYAPEPVRRSALVDRHAWDRDVADMVLRELSPAPARVLEVGCGEGRLARSMAAAGHWVVAIDPDAPQGPLFQPVSIEEFVASEPFDAAVATLSLHHIADLDAAVAKIAGLVIPGGPFVVVEFASDRLDEATATWALEHLAPASEDGWLARRRNKWNAQDSGDDGLGFADYLRRWAASENFHSATAMIDALRSHFHERRFERWPYLYPELEGVTREQEIAEIEEGRIQATGFSFVGSTRS